jgi:3'-phosphoadenosine 5'-phosphosulfate sulfotransferase (PAPS reductase)/FAD synthetase
MELFEVLEDCPVDEVIGKHLTIAYSKINNPAYEKIVCTISGGADSDIILDICTKCDKDKKIEYVWFDTGLEYKATKDHLKYLEDKYSIEIKPYKAIKPIPISCREYGQPFISKTVSNNIKRLQSHGFKWEDEPFQVLLERYCKWNPKKQDWIGCKSALRWWCSAWGIDSQLNITRNKWLKEFLVSNPPEEFGIKISDECCEYAKKGIVHKLISENNYDLNINGIRKAEGGARSTRYTSCFDENEDECDTYRPVFFYKTKNKEVYQAHYNICNSKCYTVYGLKRTGCAGCPFGRDFEFELETIKKHEPKLYVAVNSIFAQSYAYTRLYREFYAEMQEANKKEVSDQIPGQMEFEDYPGFIPESIVN